MCGIVGTFRAHSPVDLNLFNAMRDTLAHRGPDGAKTWTTSDGRIAFGHRRLKVVDLSDNGAQPFVHSSGETTSVCNGEIYNAPELRRQLEALGHRFESQCDNEVILHGFREWGTAVVDHLVGMFAFAIWHGPEQTLFVARDRLGIKPLYYWFDGENFIFASELRAIIKDSSVPRRLNLDAVNDLLILKYIPSPSTVWEGIRKLPPASSLTLHRGCLDVSRYYTPTAHTDGEVSEIVSRVVEDHLLSDVPVGILLSGGFDSSTVARFMTAQAVPPTAFSLGYSDWNKSEHLAAQTAARDLGLECKSHVISQAELHERFSDVAAAFDEPLGGTSTFPTLAIAEFAARDVRVVLAGDGGDESFSGYKRYGEVTSTSSSEDVVRVYRRTMSAAGWTDDNLSELHPRLPRPHRATRFLFEDFAAEFEGDPRRLMMALDRCFFLPELVLTKLDRATMAFSLEARVPLADHRIVERALGLTTSELFQSGALKPALRGALKGAVSESVLNHPKQGFGSPVKQGLDLVDVGRRLIEGPLSDLGVLTPRAVERLVDQKQRHALWPLIVLDNWARAWAS